MSEYFFPILFLVIIFVSLYDLKYHKVPNWVSLPLLLIGFILSFPGQPVLWMGSLLIFQAWKMGLMGGGDAKLWMGLTWCLYSSMGDAILLVMFITFLMTGLSQIVVRALTKRKIETGVKTAGAWRTVVFMGCLTYLNSAGWL
jgi:Flp pilus assembly protein protease CpaA